ncbi:hypothetical protein SEPCBS119000_004346 [Sporothrix epigloea]|uniref:Chromosome segregation ATPase family protein n=1 Tax=Sporothrix epigloea TaxID=1892477 RepID=A0ABP0DTQ7_9PEZI
MVGTWRRLTQKRKNRWDSSDPERAPPPLPLNPQSPSVGTSRPGTSTVIQSAHAALTEKARESSVSNILARRMGETSPERTPRASVSYSSSISSSSTASRSQPHRRMQSLQPNSVRDLSQMIETGNVRDSSSSMPRSPERALPSLPLTSSKYSNDPFIVDDMPNASTNPGPGPSLTPILRPIVRRPHQSILGENTPPQSATMLALQSMVASSTSPREPGTPLPVPPSVKQSLPQLPPQQDVLTQADPVPEPLLGPLNISDNSSAGGARGNVSNSGNNSLAVSISKQPVPPMEQLSKQILSLTNIATSLQKEMSALSRRSRDNATDLLSLKEATNARDEDIRKSLRELITNASEATSIRSRDSIQGGPYMLDNKPHLHPTTTSPLLKMARPFSLPRIPSPNSFAASLDRESMSTPSLYAADGPNTIAMLERIVREMGTKEGQDLLLNRLTDLVEKVAGMASASKLQELLLFVKEHQAQGVLSTSGGNSFIDNGSSRRRSYSFDDEPISSQRELDYKRKVPVLQRAERLLQSVSAPAIEQRRSSAPLTGSSDVISDDVLKIIKTVKDSVAQGGGLTAEVKALVRELRGEVLGMGREIGRRLDEVELRAKDDGKPAAATKAEMAKVVEEGLVELKQHMSNLMREHRRQSAATAASIATATAEAIPAIDYQEVYNSMRAALKDSKANKPNRPELSREDVINAVKDAWETYKPEIEVQQIGLERDEVLVCLQEGLREYAPRNDQPVGATREEVFKAVVEGLNHFVPPQMPSSGISRDEVLDAVRECLEEFEFPAAPSTVGAEISKEDMVDAVKQGLNSFDFPQTSRDLIPYSPPDTTDEVVKRLQDIMQLMRDEFRAVSNEAKHNVATNSREKDQVLDAIRDGLDKQRTDLESHVETVAAAVARPDLSEGLIRTLDVFRDEISVLMSKASDGSKQMLKDEIESLRDAVNSSLVPALPVPMASSPANNREILEALQEGVSLIRNEVSNRHINSTSEVLDAIQEGLSDLRISIDRLGNKPTDLSANDEILDALKSGLSDVRTDIDGLRDQTSNALATVETSDTAIVPADMLRHDDIKNLETLITQLRDASQIKQSNRDLADEDAENISSDIATDRDAEWKEKISEMETQLHAIHSAVAELVSRESPSVSGLEPDQASQSRPSTDAASREDVEAIETILRNTKARLDDFIDSEEQFLRKDHIDIIETLVLDTKHSLVDLKSQVDGLSSHEDINTLESLVAQVANGFEELKERHEKQFEDPERVTKSDVDAVALACLQVKSAVDRMAQADEGTGLASKDDLLSLAVIVRDMRSQLEEDAAVTAKATEERQVEIAGVGDSISDVKDFLEALNETFKTRLEDGVLGIESVGKILDSLGDTISRNSSDLHDLYETMRNEFEESRAGVVGAKLESDERLQQTSDSLEAKIDDRIGELVAKFDEFQAIADDRMRVSEGRDAEVESAVVGTKVIADELKLLIDTLGSAVTDSLEKMEEASKTVFTRVDDMVNKADDNHADAKVEHQQTRDEVQQALTAVQNVQGHVTEYHPKIFEAIGDILLVANEHFEHSKSSTTVIQEKIIEAVPTIEKYDDTLIQGKIDKVVEQTDLAINALVKLDKMDLLVDHTLTVGQALTKLDTLVENSEGTGKALDQQLVKLEKLERLEKLDQLDLLVSQSESNSQALVSLEKLAKLDQIVDLTELAGRAFDTQHDKIDKILEHTHIAQDAYAKLDNLDKLGQLDRLDQLDELMGRSRLAEDKADRTLSQLDTLEKVHQQVIQTAADLAQYMSAQTQRAADDDENRKQLLQDTNIALERRQAEQEQAAANVAALREEERRLRESVTSLRNDQDTLQRNKIRLTADVSSLETALQLRREELHEMEARAEGLERRILEGVMDHSRVLLMAKANKGREAMSRKRVVPLKKDSAACGESPSAVSARPDSETSKPQSSSALKMAMSSRRSLIPASSPIGNKANGTPNGSRRILSLSQINSGMTSNSMKRSNSVKVNGGGVGVRKSSWGGRLLAHGASGLDMDKENTPLNESDEENDQRGHTKANNTPAEEVSAVVPYQRAARDREWDDEYADCCDNQDEDGDKHSEAGTLRRSSLGTSVVTGDTQSEAGEFYSSDEDDIDVMSQWTSSQVSSAAPGEMVLYGSEQ